jgi:hypothetical protein
MNNHKAACVVLMIAIAAIVYFTQEYRATASEVRERVEDAKSSAENALFQQQIAETNLRALEAKTESIRESYQTWLPHLNGVRTPQEGEQRITQAIRKGDVFLLSQRFDIVEVSADKNALVQKALKADLVIEDDYAASLNWLGKIEEEIPSCRIDQCRMTRGERGNDIRLEVTIQIPIVAASESDSANSQTSPDSIES